jgi:predicted phage terminase large subunit-like protein
VNDLSHKAAQLVLERERAKTDKLYLATAVLGYDFQPDVHTELFSNFLILDSKKALAEQSTQKDRMILWSRGHYKTTAVVVEAIQLILNFPDIRILLMQGTIKNTEGLLGEIKTHFTGEAPNSRLTELFPEFCAKKLGTRQRFTVPARIRKQLKEATVTVASPKSVKAGQHYDVGFFDDLVNDLNYKNPKVMKKVIEDFWLYVPLIDPGGYRYVTGTRYTFGDLYEIILRKNTITKNWIISIKNCWTDDGKDVRFKERKLADGRVIGFTREKLLQTQAEDPEMFAAQYLNQPISTTAQLFTEELLAGAMRSAKADNFPALGPAVLFIDLAASRQTHRDHSVIACGQRDSMGRLYLTDIRGDRWSPDQLILNVIQMALQHRPVKIMVEGTAAGTYFIRLLQVFGQEKGVILPVEPIKVSNEAGAKFIRISSVQAALKNGRLLFLINLPRWDMVQQQFTEFPKGTHDDYPDTISLMVQFFNEAGVAPVRPIKSIMDIIKAQEGVEVNPFVGTAVVADQTGGMGTEFADY